MYKQNPQAAKAGGETEPSTENKSEEKASNDENVVDADFEEVKEDSEKKSS